MDTPISPSSSDPKTAIMNQVKHEAALNNARQLITKLNDNCFAKCIPTPGSSLSKKDETCFSMCMEKYLAAWNEVSKAYVSRIPRDGGQGAAAGEFSM